MVTQYDTTNNVSTASYTTIGFGTSIAQRNHTLQVNGDIYSSGTISTASSLSASSGYFAEMVQTSGKIKAYSGSRGDLLTLLFDGYYGYNTVNNAVVSTNYVNKTGVTPTFARTGAGQYTLTFTSPTYISSLLLCIVKDAANAFCISSNVSAYEGDYIFTFNTAKNSSLDDAVFRVSMLYALA